MAELDGCITIVLPLSINELKKILSTAIVEPDVYDELILLDAHDAEVAKVLCVANVDALGTKFIPAAIVEYDADNAYDEEIEGELGAYDADTALNDEDAQLAEILYEPPGVTPAPAFKA
jgi:hypothetical protein